MDPFGARMNHSTKVIVGLLIECLFTYGMNIFLSYFYAVHIVLQLLLPPLYYLPSGGSR